MAEEVDYLGKESLNNDGHQFHQYQQNKQHLSSWLNTKKITTYDVRNPGPGLGQKCACLFVW